jgi:hypothetical protein
MEGRWKTHRERCLLRWTGRMPSRALGRDERLIDLQRHGSLKERNDETATDQLAVSRSDLVLLVQDREKQALPKIDSWHSPTDKGRSAARSIGVLRELRRERNGEALTNQIMGISVSPPHLVASEMCQSSILPSSWTARMIGADLRQASRDPEMTRWTLKIREAMTAIMLRVVTAR